VDRTGTPSTRKVLVAIGRIAGFKTMDSQLSGGTICKILNTPSCNLKCAVPIVAVIRLVSQGDTGRSASRGNTSLNGVAPHVSASRMHDFACSRDSNACVAGAPGVFSRLGICRLRRLHHHWRTCPRRRVARGWNVCGRHVGSRHPCPGWSAFHVVRSSGNARSADSVPRPPLFERVSITRGSCAEGGNHDRPMADCRCAARAGPLRCRFLLFRKRCKTFCGIRGGHAPPPEIAADRSVVSHRADTAQ
jgi:hypothetical protein